MNPLNSPITRIIMRYVAGALVAYGLTPDAAASITDSPEVLSIVSALVGLALATASELYYMLAKKAGLKT